METRDRLFSVDAVTNLERKRQRVKKKERKMLICSLGPSRSSSPDRRLKVVDLI